MNNKIISKLRHRYLLWYGMRPAHTYVVGSLAYAYVNLRHYNVWKQHHGLGDI